MPYDVFLSHNSTDKPLVRAVRDWLVRHGVERPWLDEHDLEPGDILTDKLEEAMAESQAALIFIGPQGEGPWQAEEVRSLLNRAIAHARQKNEFRLIPVLLPDADTSKLRWFLRTRLWVDLSKGVTDNEGELFRLRQAILGVAGERVLEDDPNFNPYMGLNAFREGNARFFFGRSAACAELAGKLKDGRFACIVGPSGNGKSSLARAGLIKEAAEAECPGIGKWKRVILTPGRGLLRAFLEQLNAGRPEHERAEAVARAQERIDPRDRNSTAQELARALDEEFRAWSPGPEPVLFIVDQLEELFTHRGLRVVTDEQRVEGIRRLLDCLALLAKDGDPRWHFVLTLREDFFQRCRVSPAFWERITAKRFALHLVELDEEGWREAIKGPAARAGAYLEAGLVDWMIKDIYRQRGSMPLLQLALHGLWRSRQGACLTHQAYSALGGVARALQIRASTALRLLREENPEYGQIARNLFLRLTALGEGVSDTRRRVDRTELEWENTDPIDRQHVLRQLSDANNRLIVEDGPSVEVTHEVLIRESTDIRDWLDGPEGAREEIPILRRLSHAARRWLDQDRDPELLKVADPARVLRRWVTRTSLRLTDWEREYWKATRTQQAADLRAKRTQRLALARANRERIAQAEARANEQQRARRKAMVISFAAILFAMVAIAMWSNARQQKKLAEQVLCTGFYRTIGLDVDVTNPLVPDEREALWELATLPDGLASVRTQLLQKWNESPEGIARATAHQGRGVRAAIGIMPGSIWPGQYASSLGETVNGLQRWETRGWYRLVPQAAGLLPRLNSTQTADLIGGFVAKWTQIVDGSLLVIGSERAILETIKQLSPEMEPAQAASLVVPLLGFLRSSLETDHGLTNSAFALELIAVLIPRLEPAQATSLAQSLGEILQKNREWNQVTTVAFIRATAALAPRLNSAQARDLATPLMRRLVEAFPDDTIRFVDYAELRKAMAGLALHVESTVAAELVRNLAPATFRTDGASARFANDLASLLAPQLEESEALHRCNQLVLPLLDGSISSFDQWSALKERLAALAGGLRAPGAFSLCASLVKALPETPTTDLDRAEMLAEATVVVAARLEPSQASSIGRTFLEACRQAMGAGHGAGAMSKVAEWVAAMSTHMDAASAGDICAPVARDYVRALDQLDIAGVPLRELGSLATSLAAITAPLENRAIREMRAPFCRRLMQRLEGEATPHPLDFMHAAKGEAALAVILEPEEAEKIVAGLVQATMRILAKNRDVLVYSAVDEPTAVVLISLSGHLKRPTARIACQTEALVGLLEDERVFRRETLAEACRRADTVALIEALKWPFCVGEAEAVVLAELEKPGRFGAKFGGKVDNFIRAIQSRPEWMKVLRAPVRRPTPESVLRELDSILAGKPLV